MAVNGTLHCGVLAKVIGFELWSSLPHRMRVVNGQELFQKTHAASGSLGPSG